MKTICFALLITASLCHSAFGSLFTFEFTGTPTGDNQFNQVTTQPDHAVVSSFTRQGVLFSAQADVFKSTSLGAGAAPDPAKYMSFTITADPGYVLNLTGDSFYQENNFAGASRFDLVIYANGNETPVYTQTSVPSPTYTYNRTYDGSVLAALTGVTSVEYRLYPYQASESRYLTLDNVAASGTITAVPEPALTGIGVGTALLFFAGFRARRS